MTQLGKVGFNPCASFSPGRCLITRPQPNPRPSPSVLSKICRDMSANMAAWCWSDDQAVGLGRRPLPDSWFCGIKQTEGLTCTAVHCWRRRRITRPLSKELKPSQKRSHKMHMQWQTVVQALFVHLFILVVSSQGRAGCLIAWLVVSWYMGWWVDGCLAGWLVSGCMNEGGGRGWLVGSLLGWLTAWQVESGLEGCWFDVWLVTWGGFVCYFPCLFTGVLAASLSVKLCNSWNLLKCLTVWSRKQEILSNTMMI